jgi:hypothetical protein
LADLLSNYLDEIDEIQDVIIKDSDLILDVIDLDQLLKDPEAYLMSLGEAFLTEHLDEVEQGSKMGEKLANKMIQTIG